MNIKSNKPSLFILFLAVSFLFTNWSCYRTASSRTENILEVEQAFKINSLDELYQFFTYEENRYPLISAHRGGPYTGYPENAIETFAYIAAQLPAIIECDVRMTKDSILILMHDESINRTTTGKGVVSKLDFDKIREFNLVDNEGNETNFCVPTLEEALSWGKGRVIYTLDIKRDVPYDRVVDVIRKTNSETSVVIITYNANQAGVVYRLAPDLLISASVKSGIDLARLNDQGIPDNRIVAFVGVSEPDSSVYEQLHNHGIKTILGTLGNLDRRASSSGNQIYAELVDRGADILSTDRPIEAYEALKFYIKKRKLTSPYVLNRK